MKNKLFTLALVVAVGLTAFTQSVEAAPSRKSAQTQFNQLRAQMANLPVGSPRLVSLARRMVRLVPSAALQVASLATMTAGSSTQLDQVLNVVLSQVAIAPLNLVSVESKETLLVNVSIGVRELAPTNPRVLASAEGDVAALQQNITSTSVSVIVSLENNPSTGLSNSNIVTVVTEITGSGGGPYGA
jgi:hypothetical protein